ncbi:MAG: GNAT family N-acetyltransferase [Proteobacteria bacterium]|nr:GNAT family N-acetyltransferase [Pseudomonadota bacterium]
MLPAGLAAIRALEETTFASWPDLAHERLDGWLLRFAAGHTKRANSVNVLHADDRELERRIGKAEQRYRGAGLRPVFRLTPLAEAGLDDALAARGYAIVEPSLVKTAPMIAGLAGDPAVHLSERPGEGWLQGYVAAAAMDEAACVTLQAMLARIDGRPVYAMLHGEEGPLGFALAVTHGGRVGFFDVLTLPHARRRGIARRIMASLIAWSRDEAGASSMWIQVVAANDPARALYRDLGFATFYGYHYRVAP